MDNLIKSGKFFPGGMRRDQMPMMGGMGRPYGDYSTSNTESEFRTEAHTFRSAPRGHGGRHSYGSEFDPSRSHSGSNLQNFYASQRYGRQNDGEQMAQAKRRLAAQRERELRNYHQEQQYNRSTSEMLYMRNIDANHVRCVSRDVLQ